MTKVVTSNNELLFTFLRYQPVQKGSSLKREHKINCVISQTEMQADRSIFNRAAIVLQN